MLSFANDRMTMPQTFTRRLVAARRETPFGVCESTRAGLTLCRLQQSAPRGTSACPDVVGRSRERPEGRRQRTSATDALARNALRWVSSEATRKRPRPPVSLWLTTAGADQRERSSIAPVARPLISMFDCHVHFIECESIPLSDLSAAQCWPCLAIWFRGHFLRKRF